MKCKSNFIRIERKYRHENAEKKKEECTKKKEK